MTDRFPLIVDPSTQRVKELASGDKLDLTGSGVVADVFTVDTNSEERLRIDSAGRMGLGTTSPGSLLTLNGASSTSLGRASTFIHVGGEDFGSGSYRLVGFGYAPAANEPPAFVGYVETNPSSFTNGALVFGTRNVITDTAPTERLRIDSSGVVRIGGTDTYNSSDKLTLVNNSGNCSLTIDSISTGESSVFFADGATGNEAYRGYLQYQHSSDSLLVGTAGSERLRIDSSGRMGLGTQNPGRTLDVAGTARISSVLTMGSYIQGTTQLDLYGDSSASSGVRLDSSGRLGIGTLSPTSLLHVESSTGGALIKAVSTATPGESGVFITGRNSSGSSRTAIFKYDSADLFRIGTNAGIDIRFETNDLERVRIDSSGRLLAGTSSTSASCNALLQSAAGTGGTLILSRGTTSPASGADLGFISFNDSNHIYNSAIIRAQRDGGTWTSGTSMPTRLVFNVTMDGQLSPASRMEIMNDGTTRFNGAITSYSDNTQNIGSASVRWSTIYAATGSINTSDENLKQDIESLESAEIGVAIAIKALVKKFRFKDAVEVKSEDARIHVGVIAQEVEQAFVDAGLDPRRYGLFCEDELEDGTKRLGIRYDELLAFVIAAI